MRGVVMRDLRPDYEIAYPTATGSARKLLTLGDLLEDDDYLVRVLGQSVRLDDRRRAEALSAICAAILVLHRHGIRIVDYSENNVAVRFTVGTPSPASSTPTP